VSVAFAKADYFYSADPLNKNKYRHRISMSRGLRESDEKVLKIVLFRMLSFDLDASANMQANIDRKVTAVYFADCFVGLRVQVRTALRFIHNVGVAQIYKERQAYTHQFHGRNKS
jgi:hypothetical protein